MVAAADKAPPFDIEAEEAVIASVLVDADAIGRVEGLVQPEDFYRDQNRWAFDACLALWSRNEPINQVTLAHELARREKLDDVGGLPYLARITAELATPVGVEYYAQIVRRDATYRAMITVGSQIVQNAYRGGPDLDGALAVAENLVMGLRESQRLGDLIPLRTLLDEYWEKPGIDSVLVGSIGAIRSGFSLNSFTLSTSCAAYSGPRSGVRISSPAGGLYPSPYIRMRSFGRYAISCPL